MHYITRLLRGASETISNNGRILPPDVGLTLTVEYLNVRIYSGFQGTYFIWRSFEMKNQILDFGNSAVKSSSIQFMTALDGPNITRVGFIDGTEIDFAVNSEAAFKMWSGASVAVIMAPATVMVDFAHIAAIQFFASGHEDSPFSKKEAVFRIWFDNGELFIPTARFPHLDRGMYLRMLIDAWKKHT